MKTDSENNMMNQLFSLHSFGGRRFFLFVLLLINFQIIQAVCNHGESPSLEAPNISTAIVISEGTIVSGMEQIYVSHPKKEKIKKVFKRKSTFISSKRKQKKEVNLSQPIKNSHKTILIFSRDSQSEKSLLALSENEKQIIRPQHMMKFLLLKPESKTSVLFHLLDIYLNKIHKNHGFSHLSFSQNFNRPPPQIHSIFPLI
ncbi:hypothetical protein H5J24_07485 [Chryseobacterium capnotolerans]|uniref:hypothetical protein n=1 Tax=Chryseobacterium TaxID=59732 RepID=UPI00083A8F3D|nr:MULTISPECIES: hypothetical protein [Chryseobacterium]UHO39871.1 hypothetical protein H5J24_07485 [Chryseobacterium capnotolerans]